MHVTLNLFRIKLRDLIVLLILVPASLAEAEFVDRRGKVLEWGWHTPSPQYVYANIAAMQHLPFDGFALDIRRNAPLENSTKDFLSWRAWRQVERPENYSQSIDALRMTSLGRFTDCFLRLNLSSDDGDWYDDPTAIMTNAALLARVARTCGAKGILLDVEQYGASWLRYLSLPQHAKHSFAEYQQQVRHRGRELMHAFQSEYPDVDILLTFGYMFATRTNKDLAKSAYGLLPSLIDGLLDAAKENNVIIDGWEQSYAYRAGTDFERAYQLMHTQAAEWAADPHKFAQHYRASFGIWLDEGQKWDPEDFGHNYFTPRAFHHVVQESLKRCDGYVWIYSEKPNWWNGGIPQPYVDAIKLAHKDGRLERFSGKKDLETWTESIPDSGTTFLQNESLCINTKEADTSIAEASYTTRRLTVGAGETVSVEVTNCAPGDSASIDRPPIFGLALTNSAGDHVLSVRWSDTENAINAGVLNATGKFSYETISAADHPQNAALIYEIERSNRHTATFRVYHSNGGQLVGKPLTLSDKDIPQDLKISLFSQAAEVRFDTVWVTSETNGAARDALPDVLLKVASPPDSNADPS